MARGSEPQTQGAKAVVAIVRFRYLIHPCIRLSCPGGSHSPGNTGLIYVYRDLTIYRDIKESDGYSFTVVLKPFGSTRNYGKSKVFGPLIN